MNLTPEQEQTLAEIKVERIKDVHETIIKTIRGAVIEGKENKLASLPSSFCCQYRPER